MGWKWRTFSLAIVLLGLTSLALADDDSELSEDNCPRSRGYQCKSGKCIPKGYVCNHEADCPDRDDETDCKMKLCDGEKFHKCRSGDKCISRSLICDGEADCPDASDESDTLCDEEKVARVISRPCNNETEFMCEGKYCISKKLLCDGISHCMDGKDEDPEMCKSLNVTKSCAGFKCADGEQCLPRLEWQCDGKEDCNDKSDELHCAPHCELADGSFLCTSEDECIAIEKVCDGTADCSDKSDEGEKCKNSTAACSSLKCDGECKLLPTGPACVCEKGFTFNTTNNKCEDLLECDRYAICSQGCKNLKGSYECTCAPDFRLKNDNKTCSVYGTDPMLVYSTRKRVKSLHLNSRFTQDVYKTRQAIGVAYDGQSFFWTDMASGKESIVKFTPGKPNKEILLTAGLELPEDIAVDWLTGNIYFTDAARAHIAVCTGDGHYCNQIVNYEHIEKIRSVVLYPQRSLMYWSEWGEKAHIGVSYMDGSEAKMLVDDVSWPNGLTLDWPNARLYWVDAKRQVIESVKFTGDDRRVVLEGLMKHPFGLAVFEDRLYWSDWETQSIEACDKFTGKNHEVLVQGQIVYDVHIYHEAMMPKQKHACEAHQCSHICLLGKDSSYSCYCPENMELMADKHTCRQVSKQFNIIMGISDHIVSLPYQTFGGHETAFADEVAQTIDRMVFNSINGEVIIALNLNGKILTVDMKRGKMFDLVTDHVSHVKSMDFDYLANNLYWIDDDKNTLEIYSLHMKKRAILQHFSENEKPIAIALVPSKGEYFVALQSSGHVHIDRQMMAGGSGHFHVIETGLSSKGPIHFAVDEANEMIYWADGSNKRIEFCNVKGNNRQTFVNTTKSPGTIAIVGKDLFWSSFKSGSFRWLNLNRTGSVKQAALDLPMGKTPEIIQLIAGTPLKVSDHPCMTGNGGCSDICLSDGPTSRVCLCQAGNVFKDSTNTKCVLQTDCGFRCSDSHECLEPSRVCDKKSDCLDESDERNCTKEFACDSSEFMCSDKKKCIPLGQYCDQHHDCDDHSDETHCDKKERTQVKHCRDHQIRCPKEDFCLDITQRCDGKNDCSDGFDELPENCKTCPKDFFRCASGQCVPKEFVCNGHINCKDGSDEHSNCSIPMCKSNTKPCLNGWCINENLFCDGHEDCQDGFDEKFCEPKSDGAAENSTCDLGQYQCSSDPSRCLPFNLVCDGKPDCPIGEDETRCAGCPVGMFECDNDVCIVSSYTCDGSDDCGDGSDERNCKAQETVKAKACESSDFTCSDGSCLKQSSVCDGLPDCTGGDDESEICNTACDNTKCENCRKTPKGGVCYCKEGFIMPSTSDSTCVDIDECKTLDPCSQICNNTNGSFRCSCHDGFILGPDKISCQAMGSDSQVILFTNLDQIRQISQFPHTTQVQVNVSGNRISDFDVDMFRKKIFFTVAGDNELIEMDMKADEHKVMKGVPRAHRIAYDWIAGNTYLVHYPDDMQVEIHVCNMQMDACALLKKFSYFKQIPSIRVDPINKLLFYVELENHVFFQPKSMLVKMRLDASNAQTISNDTHITALSLDIDERKVFFTEMDSMSLQVVDYSGDNRQIISKQTGFLKRPVAMSLFENHAYILNQMSPGITRCSLYGNRDCRKIEISETMADRILVAHKTQQKRAPNNCDNHPCDVICIAADVGFKCLCANGTSVKQGVKCNGSVVSTDALSSDGGSSWWWWIFSALLLVSLIAVAFVMYRRRSFHGTFNVSMHFANNEICKIQPQDMKPTPFPRATTAGTQLTVPSAPGVNTLNKNCHEFAPDDFSYYKSANSLSRSSTEVDGFSDADGSDVLENVDISNDPRERLIC